MRFILTWEEIEISPGVYNEARLAELRKKILEAQKNGEEVIVEMQNENEHPDAFAHAKRRLKNCQITWQSL